MARSGSLLLFSSIFLFCAALLLVRQAYSFPLCLLHTFTANPFFWKVFISVSCPSLSNTHCDLTILLLLLLALSTPNQAPRCPSPPSARPMPSVIRNLLRTGLMSLLQCDRSGHGVLPFLKNFYYRNDGLYSLGNLVI